MASPAAHIEGATQDQSTDRLLPLYYTNVQAYRARDILTNAEGSTSVSEIFSPYGTIGRLNPIHLEGDLSDPTRLVHRLVGEAEAIFENHGDVRAETTTDNALVAGILANRGWSVLETRDSVGQPLFEASRSFPESSVDKADLNTALSAPLTTIKQEVTARFPRSVTMILAATENGKKDAHITNGIIFHGIKGRRIPTMEPHDGHGNPDPIDDAGTKLDSAERMLAEGKWEGRKELSTWRAYKRGRAPMVAIDIVTEIPQIEDGQVTFVSKGKPNTPNIEDLIATLEELYLFGQAHALTEVPVRKKSVTRIRHPKSQDTYSVRTVEVSLSVRKIRELLTDPEQLKKYQEKATHPLSEVAGGIEVVALKDMGLVTGIRESDADTVIRPQDDGFANAFRGIKNLVEGQVDEKFLDSHTARYRPRRVSLRGNAHIPTRREGVDESRREIEYYGYALRSPGEEQKAQHRIDRLNRELAREEYKFLKDAYLNHFGFFVAGSARIPPGSPDYILIKQIVRGLVDKPKFTVVNGAGPGLMNASTEAVSEAKEEALRNGHTIDAQTHGITLYFPGEERPNVDYYNVHDRIDTRARELIARSHFAYFGVGSVGTDYELKTIFQLQQLRNFEDEFVIIAHPSWRDEIETKRRIWYEERVANGERPLMDKDNLRVIYSDDPEAINRIVTESYNKWWENYGQHLRYSRFLPHRVYDLLHGRAIRRRAASAA